MSATRKVIISCAVTGSIHTPSMSRHLPITARQIIEAMGLEIASPDDARKILALKGRKAVAF